MPESSGLALIALAIFAAAWVQKTTTPPRTVNAIAWIVIIVTAILFLLHWLPIKLD